MSYWYSNEDLEKLSRQFSYLKNYDRILNSWRDINKFKFNASVLDKYKEHEYCKLITKSPDDYVLYFLDFDKKTITDGICFHITDNTVIINAEELVFIPPKERPHWKQHQIEGELEW